MASILLIGDNSVMLRSSADTLRAALPDVEMHVATRGEMARVLVREIGPALVIVNRELPDEDGMMLFMELRSTSPGLEGILIAAKSDGDAREQVHTRGFAALVESPYEADVLVRETRAVLEVGMVEHDHNSISPARDALTSEEATRRWRHDVKNMLSGAIVGLRAFEADLIDAENTETAQIHSLKSPWPQNVRAEQGAAKILRRRRGHPRRGAKSSCDTAMCVQAVDQGTVAHLVDEYVDRIADRMKDVAMMLDHVDVRGGTPWQ